MVGDVHDVIVNHVCHFKFKYKGVTILQALSQGVVFSIFLLIFAWVFQWCSANGLRYS